MKAIGYARVSTRGQSLDVQIEQIKRFCEYRNIDMARLYADKASGVCTPKGDGCSSCPNYLPRADFMEAIRTAHMMGKRKLKYKKIKPSVVVAKEV